MITATVATGSDGQDEALITVAAAPACTQAISGSHGGGLIVTSGQVLCLAAGGSIGGT